MSSAGAMASKSPSLRMVDEGAREKYARVVGQMRLKKEGEMDRLVKDRSVELPSWGDWR